MQPDLPYPDRSTRLFAEAMFGREGLVRRINIAMLVILAVIPIVLIDWIRSATTLITPIPSAVTTGCLIGGCALGLILAGLMAVLAWVQKGPKGRSIGVTTATFLFFALMFTPLYALASMRVAWRAAEIEAFGWHAPVTWTAHYPIILFDQSSRGSAKDVTIEPYHAGLTSISITDADYRKLATKGGGRLVSALLRQSASRTIRQHRADREIVRLRRARQRADPLPSAQLLIFHPRLSSA